MMADSLMGVSITRSQPKRSSKPFGHFERAAVDADIFADEHDCGIAIHLLEERLADGFQHGDCGHQLLLSRAGAFADFDFGLRRQLEPPPFPLAAASRTS